MLAPPGFSRRRDPRGLVHVGFVMDYSGGAREWIPRCAVYPRSDPVFWTTCIGPDVPTTCLGCLVKEFT